MNNGSQLAVSQDEVEDALWDGISTVDDSQIETAGGEEINDVRQKIKSLKELIGVSYLSLGGLLYRVKYGRYYVNWGFDGFGDYTEAELGFRKRKAQYLISIWKKFRVELGLEPNELAELQWTKAAELQRVANSDNVDELVEWASEDEVTVRDVKERVRNMVASERAQEAEEEGEQIEGDEDPEQVFRKTFSLYDEQNEVVENALEIAAGIAESDKEGHLLTSICMEWMAGAMESRDIQLKWILGRIEDEYGISLIGINEEEETVVYGEEVLD